MPKILVIAPHADDAEFGMGGTLTRMAREGTAEPHVGVVAGGDYIGRLGQTVFSDTRMQETKDAMGHLGVRQHYSLGTVRENEFDLVGRKVLIDQVDALLMKADFEEVFVCLSSHNQDHVALFDATMAAFRPGRWENVKRILAYEYPGHNVGGSVPRFGRSYVRIEAHDLNQKMLALGAHKSQFEDKPENYCGPTGARMLAQLRGAEAGARFAELFWLIREVV
jgi:LmbE family N-acetylglucosaminyl deacetylase